MHNGNSYVVNVNNSEVSQTASLDENISNEEEEKYDSICLICFDSYLSNDSSWLVRSKNCGCQKIYHLKCFYSWYKDNKSCPICHADITDNDLEIMIYHNSKWEILPLHLVSNIFLENNLNEVYNDDSSYESDDDSIDETNSLCCSTKLFDCINILILIVCILMLGFLIILALIIYSNGGLNL